MNMKITEGLTVTERRNQKGENHYSRYLPSFFIDDDCFSSAIKRLGGYTYNVCVGKSRGGDHFQWVYMVLCFQRQFL